MRPLKSVLIIDPDEDRQGLTRFVLRNHYMVLSASSIYEACEIDRIPDLLLGYSPIDERRFADLGRGLQRPAIFVASAKNAERFADATVFSPPAVDLLERIKVMIARKRGPRKGTPRVRKYRVLTDQPSACVGSMAV